MSRRFPKRCIHALFPILIVADALAGVACAEEQFLASVRLRGGYDTNPMLNLGTARATAFLGTDAVFVSAMGDDRATAALTGEATYTHFLHPEIDPLQRYRLGFNFANKVEDGLSIRADASALSFRNYDTQLQDLEYKLRLRHVGQEWQPFLRAELRYSSPNEKNVVLGEFLPEPQKFLRSTIIPGVAWKKGKLELGASASLSVTRYEEELDYFGFRRDNERYQPFLFAEFAGENVQLFAAISRLYGDWHDVDFSDVRRTLFHVTAEFRCQKYALEVAALRIASDTTFPISPVSIDTTYSVKLSQAIDEKTSAAIFARQIAREFLDSPFRSRTDVLGIEMSHELGDETALGFELAQLRAAPIIGEAVNGTVGFVSLTKRTAADPERKLRAGRTSPAR